MNRRDNRTKGFTLIEEITTLMIIGILAAMVVPAMTGWIDKAKGGICANNRRQILRFYQYQSTLQYLDPAGVTLGDVLNGVYPATRSDVLSLDRCPACGKAYQALGNTDLQCTLHGSLGVGGDKLIYQGGDAPNITLAKAMEEKSIAQGNIDSSNSEGAKVQLINAYLAARGIDLAAQGVKNWKIQKEGSFTTFVWTSEDISTLADGTMVRVIRYNSNPTFQTYTAGYFRVATNDKGGKILKNTGVGSNNPDWKETAGQSDASKQSYEETLAIYNSSDSVMTK